MALGCKPRQPTANGDQGRESFELTTPKLPRGWHQVRVRATNSVGNVQTQPTTHTLVIPESDVDDAPPMAGFKVTPPSGSIQTSFALDANLSRDREDGASVLEVRWDFDHDGTWDTDFSLAKHTTHQFHTPGTQQVTLQVRDTIGQTHTTSQAIEVSATNLAPHAHLTVTPENRHGSADENFRLHLDATRSWDAENDNSNLLFRWDFQGDGIWDTEYTSENQRNYDHVLPEWFAYFYNRADAGVFHAHLAGNLLYAVVGPSFVIFDVTDPTNPMELGSLEFPLWTRDMAVAGQSGLLRES